MNRETIAALAAFLLLALCILNVNGVAVMMFEQARVASALILALCAVLLMLGGFLVPKPAIEYQFVVAAFLVSATLWSLVLSAEFQSPLLLGPAGSGLLVLALTCGLTRQRRFDRDRIIAIVVLLAAISSCAVIFSPWLYSIYKVPPPDSQRLAGFFGNPNEAAMVAVMGLAYALGQTQITGARVHIGAAIICGIAIVATFSKAGILAAFVITIMAFFAGTRARTGVYKLITASVVLVLAFFALGYQVELELRQVQRLEELLSIVQLDINAETSTNRTFVWEAAVAKVLDNRVIIGSGLGSLRAIEGGLLEDGYWRGAHNFWLMLVGEGGVVALVPAMIFFSLLSYKAWRVRDYRVATMAYPIVFFIDSFSSHNIFELRFHAAFLALTIYLIALDGCSRTLTWRKFCASVNRREA